MPLAPIDDKGTSVYYEDSGVPSGSPTDYTTIVIVHGLIINGATFRRLLSYAPDHGLRVVTMNMRDYRGSTPYSSEELADMTNPDIDVQTFAVRRFGREIANFLLYVCDTMGIPEVVVDGEKKSGGIMLMTWSLSNIAALAILGDPDTLGDGKLKLTLTRYLRKTIFYDPPAIVYGIYPEIGFSFPLTDPKVPDELRPDVFIEWCSGYYKPLPDGAPISAESLQGCTLISEKTPTLLGIPPEEQEASLDRSVLFASGLIMRTDMSIRQRNARRALLDADAALPKVEIVVLWADLSVFLCVWAVKVVREILEDDLGLGKRKRRVSILRLENANHFYHLDEPEKMVTFLKDITHK